MSSFSKNSLGCCCCCCLLTCTADVWETPKQKHPGRLGAAEICLVFVCAGAAADAGRQRCRRHVTAVPGYVQSTHITPRTVQRRVLHPAGTHTNTGFQQSLKHLYFFFFLFPRLYLYNLPKPFFCSKTSDPHFSRQMYCFIFYAGVVCSREKKKKKRRKDRESVRRDNSKKKERGHCLYLIPVKPELHLLLFFFAF